jgi:SAM-dependent methyltransferase
VAGIKRNIEAALNAIPPTWWLYNKVFRRYFRIDRLRRRSNAFLQALFKEKEFGLVLNLGCGTDSDLEGGRYSDYIRAKRVFRVDVSPDLPNLDAVAGAENLPYPADYFDLVFMNWAFHHTDMDRSWPEIKRVLKPGGALLISFGGVQRDDVLRIRERLAGDLEITQSMESDYRVTGETRYGVSLFGRLLARAKPPCRP